MFRRNNPVSGLQRSESSDSIQSQQGSQELPLRPTTTMQAQPMTSRPISAAPLAPQPVSQPQQTTTSAGKPADLPVSRFGGIPGVMPRRVGTPAEIAAQGGSASSLSSLGEQSGLRKLIVGREITLSGDITTCDILMVEGNIDATLRDGKILEITQAGHFRGAAEVDEADIAGKFEGNLTVRGRLKLRSTGQIEGTLSYGELEVEAGGRLVGELKVLGNTTSSSAKATKREESSAEA